MMGVVQDGDGGGVGEAIHQHVHDHDLPRGGANKVMQLVAFVILVATIRTYHHLGLLTRKTPRHSVSCCRLPSPAAVCAACSGPASAWQCQA